MKEQKSCENHSPHKELVSDLINKKPSFDVFTKCASFFKALSDPTRAKIIWALDQCELCVCDLSEFLEMTPSAISHQLSGLRKNNMVKFRKEGKEVFYSLADDHISIMLHNGIEHTAH